jgi:O-glycosyl hydrolase
MTECSGGGWSGPWSTNFITNMKELFIGNANNWGQSTLLWNMALDENSGPHCQVELQLFSSHLLQSCASLVHAHHNPHTATLSHHSLKVSHIHIRICITLSTLLATVCTLRVVYVARRAVAHKCTQTYAHPHPHLHHALNTSCDGVHTEGGACCTSCRGVITVPSNASTLADVTRNVEFYSLAHFSTLVPPASLRVNSTAPAGHAPRSVCVRLCCVLSWVHAAS